jgi:hypothetical protein
LGKVRSALNQYRAQILQHAKIKKEAWVGDTLEFEIELQGKKVPGSLVITEEEYVLDATLPLMWRIFEGKIQKEIAKQVQGL